MPDSVLSAWLPAMPDGVSPAWLMAVVVGLVLGLFFYGGLYWTVQRAMRSSHPGLLLIGSLAFRTAVAVAGIWAIAGGQWQPMLLCLLGFVMARPLVVRLTMRLTQIDG